MEKIRFSCACFRKRRGHAPAKTSILAGCALILTLPGPGTAETVANWRFDDGAAPDTADTLATEVNAPTLNGSATQNGSGAKPAFSDDRPGDRIWASFTGPLLNGANAASLRFVNAGLPVNTNSSDGGVVTVPDNDPLLRATNLTVEAFLKVDRRVNWPLVVGKARGGNNTSWNLDFDNAGRPRVRIDSGVAFTNNAPGFNESVTSSVGVEDGQWHHVAFTYTHASQTVRLYVDYVQTASRPTHSNLVYDTGSLRIGQGAGGRAFDGWIDEVRITDDVLQPHQFMTVLEPSPTRVYLPFEDGTAETTANVLTNAFYAPFLHGTAGTVNGGVIKPSFSAERPPASTARISNGLGGPVVNQNAGSLFFVNAGLPDNANSPSGGVVTVSGSAVPVPMTNFTAEAFVRVNRHVGFPQIIGKSRPGGLAWSLALNSSGNLRARFDTQIPPDTAGNNQSFESSAKIEDGQWHHVALTYDYPTQTVRLYKDYVKVHEGTTINPLWLDTGNYQIGAGDMAFDGWIDEVRLSNRVLEPEEFFYAVPVEGTLIRLQ
jgi:hypothetical protein